MRYAVLNGGKRIRPLLVYASRTGCLDVEPQALDVAACAVECIHAYSLVHDDLPAMDDDDLRRGKPTCHKVFGEAEAILAGDALQTLAFLLARPCGHGSGTIRQPAADDRTAGQASGSRGMAGGQSIDLAATGKQLDIAELEDMHIHKTGALIRASVLLGALLRRKLGDDPAPGAGSLREIYRAGLSGSGRYPRCNRQYRATRQTGWRRHGALNKPTYPSLLGLSAARANVPSELHQAALDSLSGTGSERRPIALAVRRILSTR